MMRSNIYASLEFGTHSIKLLVSEFIDEKQNILFIDEEITTGVEIGQIIDKTTVFNDVKKLILKCEDFLSAKIKAIVLMLPSIGFNNKVVNYDITIPENIVRGKHIKYLFNKVYEQEVNALDRVGEIAAIYPINFTTLNSKKRIDNPIGENTRGINASLEVIYVNHQMLIDYISIIEQLGIDIIDIMPNVIGYKGSLLSKEEMENYLCVVDIGALTTTVTTYHKQVIHACETFKLGVKAVTDNLRDKLGLENNDAEDLKITHGNCISKDIVDEIVFEQRQTDGSITYITSEFIAKIVEERYLEIIRVIKKYLLESGLKGKIQKFILIGGGVQIENFEKLFRYNFGENSTIRSPNLIGTRHPKYSSIISGQYNILYFEQLFEEKYEMVVFK